jgi:hypothetical protein
MKDAQPNDLPPGLLRPGECVLWLGHSDASRATTWLLMILAVALPLGLYGAIFPPVLAYDVTFAHQQDVRWRPVAAALLVIGGAVAGTYAYQNRRHARRYVVTNQRTLVVAHARVLSEIALADVSSVDVVFGPVDQLAATAVQVTGKFQSVVFAELAQPDVTRRAVEHALEVARRDAKAVSEPAASEPPKA